MRDEIRSHHKSLSDYGEVEGRGRRKERDTPAPIPPLGARCKSEGCFWTTVNLGGVCRRCLNKKIKETT